MKNVLMALGTLMVLAAGQPAQAFVDLNCFSANGERIEIVQRDERNFLIKHFYRNGAGGSVMGGFGHVSNTEVDIRQIYISGGDMQSSGQETEESIASGPLNAVRVYQGVFNCL